MSLPESNDEHKITSVDSSETKGDAGKCNTNNKNKATSSSVPDENHGTKATKTNCHNNHNNNTTTSTDAASAKGKNDLAGSIEGLKLTPTNSDDNEARNDWVVRAKDSLESVPPSKGASDITSSKSTSCTAPKEKCLISESPHSESLIGTSKSTCANSVSKVLAWDPWNKLGRQNKKENKRRKYEKNDANRTCSSPKDKNRKDFKAGDEARVPADTQQAEGFEYEYQPYQKNLRSVDFTSNVMVVYINKEDKVVGESSEPLKKELEQQIRNKEMRKGHMPDVAFAKRTVSDFFKK